MKPFHVVRQSKRRERIDMLMPWLILPGFILGVIAEKNTKAWPAWNRSLRWAGYVSIAVYCIYLLLTLIRIAREPVNYHSLRLSDRGLEYEPTRSQRLVIAWNEIEHVIFCREEAVFENYLETKWLIKVRATGKTHEIMDEWESRRPIVRALRRFVPGFDVREAWKGIRSRRKGKWVCVTRASEEITEGMKPNRTV